MIKGIAASNGIAIAKAYKLDMRDLTVTQIKVADEEAEIAKLEATLVQVEADLNHEKTLWIYLCRYG